MGFRLNTVWTKEPKIALIDWYKYVNPNFIIKFLEVNNLILKGQINNLSFTQIDGRVIQDGGEWRRNVIQDIGSFIFTNEIVPSIDLISGNEYELE